VTSRRRKLPTRRSPGRKASRSGLTREADAGGGTRFRSLRPDAELPRIWRQSELAGQVIYRETIPPGPERDGVVEALQAELRARAARLDISIDALQSLLLAHEPVEFINAIAIPTSMGLRDAGPAVDDAPDTVTWPAKIEYLVGLALSGPPGTGHAPTATTDKAISLLGDVFDGASAKQLLGATSRESTGSHHLDEASLLFGVEHLFDRMPGYPRHLEQIDAEVFDGHRSFYVDQIGFNPADVGRVVRRRATAAQKRADHFLPIVNGAMRQDPETAAVALKELFATLDGTRLWGPASVASDAGIAAEEIEAMLAFFSTTFGSQPAFREPTDENLFRTRPCIDLGTGIFFVPDPWALSAAVHLRMAEEVAAHPTGTIKRYRHHREDGHERLVAKAFRRVFGDPLVGQGRHYASPSSGPGEIDVLVRTEWPLVAEAKAHGLTDAGRRGAPGRVKRVSQDLVEKALDQTHRARMYILDEAGRSFSDREGGAARPELDGEVHGLTELVVTFERMDPLGRQGPGIVDLAGYRVWIICIADLLMVVDLLPDPGAFHHYARVRAEVATSGPVVHMESDVLGAYMKDRIAQVSARAAAEPDVTVMLGYSSSEINRYYTDLELGLDADKPATRVPEPIVATLSATTTSHTGVWVDAVDAVMAATPRTWRKWRSFVRRHKGIAVFGLSDRVEITSGPMPEITRSGDGRIELRTRERRT